MSVLVIGSVTCDVSLYVDHLPSAEEDISVRKQKLSLGGCAYNVSNMLRLTHVDYRLTACTGKGIFGDFVRKELKKQKQEPMFESEEENGVCYTLIDRSGSRTFAAVHGAEYHFTQDMLNQIFMDDVDLIYFCGLEIEEKTGDNIISFLKKHQNIPMFFAPGPRISMIPEDRMNRILAMHPSVHLNYREGRSFLDDPELRKAETVISLHEKGFDSVIMTDGEKPVTVYDHGNTDEVSAFRADVKDSTGAGDSHIGTVLSCLEKGMDLKKAVRTANRISAAVTECEGPVLTDEKFEEIRKELL